MRLTDQSANTGTPAAPDAVGAALRSLLIVAMLLVGILLTSAAINWQRDRAAYWVMHTAAVISAEAGLLSTCQEIAASSRGYAVQKDAALLRRFNANVKKVPAMLASLAELTADNPAQTNRLRVLRPLVDELIASCLKMVQTGKGAPVLMPSSTLSRIGDCLEGFVEEEKRLLAKRQEASNSSAVWAWAALIVQLLFSLVLLVVVGRSITSYRHQSLTTIDSLDKARNTAEEASRFKTQLVANVSHEIRTPLSSLLALVELISEAEELAPSTKRMVDLLHESSKQLMTVLNDLLDFGKLEAGRVRLDAVEFSIGEIAKDIESLNFLLAKKRDISLKLTIDPETPERMIGDPDKFRHVLHNLVSNAIKFTEAGSVEIFIEPKGDKLRVRVADTGIGIPPDAQDKLFRPFVQIESHSRRKYGGTGLGLAIVKQYVELMGGDIGFTTQEGAGSTFWFELPLNAVPDKIAAAK